MKRFYTATGISAAPEGFQVTLDAKPLRTPARHALTLPTEALALAVAQEWAAQKETIDKAAMPLTALACIALDMAQSRAPEMRAELANYATTDQLCYREPHGPTAEAQARLGDPLLAWAQERHKATLEVTGSIVPVQQLPEALAALEEALQGLSAWELAALSLTVGITRSLIVGLALLEGRIDGAQAFALASLEEEIQAEQWGMDPVQRARLDGWRRDLLGVEQFLALLA